MKKFTQIIFTLICLLSTIVFANTGETNFSANEFSSEIYVEKDKNKIEISQSEIKWIRIESPDKDWSFAIPDGYLADIDGENYIIYFRSEGLSIRVVTDELKNAKKRLKFNMSFLSADELKEYKFFEVGDFIGGYSKSEKEDSNFASYSLRFASDSGLSTIYISDSISGGEIAQKFLKSIHLGDKFIFTSTNTRVNDEQIINISSLTTDKSILDAVRVEDSNQKELIKSLEKDDQSKDESKNDKETYSKPLLVVRRPRPSYTNNARERRISGFAKLKVSFLANGRIGDIELITSLDKGLDKAAFNAAKKIKFLPAEINGLPVNVNKIVQYNFTVY